MLLGQGMEIAPESMITALKTAKYTFLAQKRSTMALFGIIMTSPVQIRQILIFNFFSIDILSTCYEGQGMEIALKSMITAPKTAMFAFWAQKWQKIAIFDVIMTSPLKERIFLIFQNYSNKSMSTCSGGQGIRLVPESLLKGFKTTKNVILADFPYLVI